MATVRESVAGSPGKRPQVVLLVLLRDDLNVHMPRPDREQTSTLLTEQRGRVGITCTRFAQPFRFVREAAAGTCDGGGQPDLASRLPPVRYIDGMLGGAVLVEIRHVG